MIIPKLDESNASIVLEAFGYCLKAGESEEHRNTGLRPVSLMQPKVIILELNHVIAFRDSRFPSRVKYAANNTRKTIYVF